MILGSPSHRNWQTKSEDEKSQQLVALQLFDGVLDRFPSPTFMTAYITAWLKNSGRCSSNPAAVADFCHSRCRPHLGLPWFIGLPALLIRHCLHYQSGIYLDCTSDRDVIRLVSWHFAEAVRKQDMQPAGSAILRDTASRRGGQPVCLGFLRRRPGLLPARIHALADGGSRQWGVGKIYILVHRAR
jgi:hypothetical protein